MASLNKVMLIGNLGQDPELRYTNNGTPACNINVATTRTWMDKSSGQRQEETEWTRVVIWGKQAENCSKFLSKGSAVFIEGYLRTTTYERDGQTHYSTGVVADKVQFLDRAPSSDGRTRRSDSEQLNSPAHDRRRDGGYDRAPSHDYDDSSIPF